MPSFTLCLPVCTAHHHRHHLLPCVTYPCGFSFIKAQNRTWLPRLLSGPFQASCDTACLCSPLSRGQAHNSTLHGPQQAFLLQ